MARAYYNEIDPFAAAWLRELISAGHIAPGDVDERDIRDVTPGDLHAYTQCHFFAGIGVWSYALRCAGWPDDKPAWTGSCPCQPFSSAGGRAGFADERHLWPAWHHLIRICRPRVVFGEQVASPDGLAWLDLVQADMEGEGYAIGAADLCAAGVGAPHIRQRLWFVAQRLADGIGSRLEGHAGYGDERHQPGRIDPQQDGPTAAQGVAGGVGVDDSDGRQPGRQGIAPMGYGGAVVAASGSRWLGDTERISAGRDTGASTRTEKGARLRTERDDAGSSGAACRPSPVNGLWRDADWLFCRDGKWRPTSPIPQPMADGSAESLGRVRPESAEEIEEAINAQSVESEVNPAALLRDLQGSLAAQAEHCWPAGGIPGLHEAPFLLAFLRQLSEQGWRFSKCSPVPSPEALEEIMRGMRTDTGASCASCERGLEGRISGEHSDALRVLSSVLARRAQEDWGKSYEAYAESCFVLTSNARSRVGRLRGYGNAIVASVAQAVIESYMGWADGEPDPEHKNTGGQLRLL